MTVPSVFYEKLSSDCASKIANFQFVLFKLNITNSSYIEEFNIVKLSGAIKDHLIRMNVHRDPYEENHY